MDFGLLGPIAVWKDGRELALGGAKQRAVLAILLLRSNELVPTERLIDELWDGRPPATAVKALQVHVSQLRKVLGDGVIETGPSGYVLRVEPGAVDLQRFERLVADGRRLLDSGAPAEAADVLRRALALWRGPPLADFQYDPFARNEIGRLEELRHVALEQRLEAELALGRHAEIVGELEALVRDQPLREGPRRLLMLALYRSGRQADALAAYRDARETLVDELGLDPGQGLQQLEQAILRQDPSLDLPAPPARAPLPQPVSEAPPPVNWPIEGRKTVTVLFCDVVAVSELADRLDPEYLRNMLSDFFERAAATVEQHGGTVEKVIGDEVMAVFGVPVVHEDDALRAVRAAVELRDAVKERQLEVRIGVNTGEVVAGDPAAGHGLVSGDAVARGRRLEEAAGPGEVVLGPETHALLAHAVTATPLEGIAGFRLDAFDPEAVAVPRRDDARFVGRAGELEWLRELYGKVAAGTGARRVTIVGEPGIGKSRFSREALEGLAPPPAVLVGRCPPYGAGITYWPLRELLRQADRDDVDLTGSGHEVFAMVRHLLVDRAAEGPVVVVFDDVHWAEPTFLDLVEDLAARLGDARVLLLCLARPQLAELRPAWVQPPSDVLLLEPLSQDESELLLESLGAPDDVRPRIAEAAEGNPLFAEQLAAIADALGSTAMPGSIRGVLHERLDRLERGERSVLERGAVFGRSFSLGSVLELSPPEERDSVQPRLLSLIRQRFIRPDPLALDEGFRFQHALIRDAVYDAMPKALRAELHERIAERLEDEAADDALVGYHLERVFGFRRELGRLDSELGAQAGALLGSAGEQAFARSDLPATISLLERARKLVPPDESVRLLPRLGQALFEAGRLAEADEILAEAIEQAGADALLESRARVEQQFVRLQVEPGAAIGDAQEVATAALRVFEEHADELGRCRALCLRASVEWGCGHSSEADGAWLDAAVHARAADDERELFEILGWRASAAVVGPTPVVEAIERCTEICEQVHSSRVAVAVTLHPLAALHAMQGDFGEARSLIQQANAILEDAGRMQSAVSHHEVLAEMLGGNPAKAEERLRLGYERLEQMGEKSLLATTAALLAQAVYEQERYAEAERFSEVSERTAAAEDLSAQVIWRGVRAKLLARAGRVDEAVALAREAVRLIAQTDLLTRHGDALFDLADVLSVGGRADDADAAFREALRLYERKGNAVSAARVHARLAAPVAR